MWQTGISLVLAAGGGTSQSGSGDQFTLIVGGIIAAAVTGVFSLLVAFVMRSNKTAPAPPAADEQRDITTLHERVAVLERRSDDSDERDEVQDRRLDQLERNADLDNPEWRHGR